jgi:hypothetical protein
MVRREEGRRQSDLGRNEDLGNCSTQQAYRASTCKSMIGLNFRQQTQRLAIREVLDTISLSQLAAPSALSESLRGAKQIVHMLVRLAHVWRPIMQPSRLHAVLGQLVMEILVLTMKEVEDMQDIGEEDSKRINEVCKVFEGLEACFEDVRRALRCADAQLEQTSVGLHVPLWFKFAYLSEILDGSMVRANGCSAPD